MNCDSSLPADESRLKFADDLRVAMIIAKANRMRVVERC